MSWLRGLRCRECHATYPIDALFVCEECFGPLEAYYDETARNAHVTRENIANGPRTLWRYHDFLPSEYTPRVDLNDGWTPLLRARNLGRELGLNNLYLKNDTVNPTFSFKDRVVSVAAAKALEFDLPALACASTGNLAGAVAAHAARAGLPSYVFIPADLEPAKILSAAIYGATIVAVQGDYDQANRLATEAAETYGWGFVNINLRPYYAEGSKTLAYEVAEQLGWRAPDAVIAPVASGALYTKINRGFEELYEAKLIAGPLPKMIGAQAAGCAPVAHAFGRGTREITPVKARSIAKSLAIGNPADGRYAIDAARKSDGGIFSIPESAVAEGMALLARTEGIFGETAAGVTISVLKKLADARTLDPDETVVAYITGNGLKTREAIKDVAHQRIDTEPNLESFQEQFEPQVFAVA
ncbi:MAG: threonine synthase [Chloroflexi bacterium UTCFX4]|nr:MAG: threonine synthase [Chloroflexi bacterium UTCFX4]